MPSFADAPITPDVAHCSQSDAAELQDSDATLTFGLQ